MVYVYFINEYSYFEDTIKYSQAKDKQRANSRQSRP